jgi:formylglycine-generating enzyme required for sulfatase activity
VGRVDLYGIQHGLFPYHPNPMFAPNPNAPDFAILHPEIQAAFLRCFVHSYTNPTNRPTAREWAQFLAQAERSLIPCQRNPRHVYPHHLATCPWCLQPSRPAAKPIPNVIKTVTPPIVPPISTPPPTFSRNRPTSNNPTLWGFMVAFFYGVYFLITPLIPPPALRRNLLNFKLSNNPRGWGIIIALFYGLYSLMTLFNKIDRTSNFPTPAPNKTIIAAFTPVQEMPMIPIPAGNFKMGSNMESKDEQPMHTVYLADYEIDKYEVTNFQYTKCVSANKCSPPHEIKYNREGYDYNSLLLLNFPVVHVDWLQAKDYCEFVDKRLPTEAEWEKAARGTDGRAYPWGNEFDGTKLNYCDKNCPLEHANMAENDGYADIASVGRYELGQSPYGVYDLSGNVTEWTSSDYRPYPYQANDGRENETISNKKMLRGGSAYDGYYGSRSSFRVEFNPISYTYYIGFRCARSVDPTATPKAPSTAKPISSPTPDGMIHIPAGAFIMGSDSQSEAEKPAHTVYLADYEIDKYETTNAQYAACVNAGKCEPPHETTSQMRARYYGNAEFANYPVINIDWTQAKSYCEFAGKRLPTEAEWEKAARGTDGRTYPWGNEDPSCDRLNYSVLCKVDTTPVGLYPRGASPYGVMDMAGNVWEWTSSDYKPYPYKSDDEREELLSNNKKVLRGGSWGSNGNETRVTGRVSLATSNWNKNFGGRCAR